MPVSPEEMLEGLKADPILVSMKKAGITGEALSNALSKELFYLEPAKKKPTFKAMMIRQRARQDAHKLRGDYPPEQHEVGGFEGKEIKIKVVFDKKKGNGNGGKD